MRARGRLDEDDDNRDVWIDGWVTERGGGDARDGCGAAGADGDADVVVLVVSEATFEREETVETMATMCARAEGDGTDVVVVCEGERTSEMEATSSRVGIPLAEALDTAIARWIRKRFHGGGGGEFSLGRCIHA